MLQKIMDLQILLYCMAAFGCLGVIGMFATHLTYRRILKRTNAASSSKEKWLSWWKKKDRLLRRMNLMVWLPSLLSTASLGLALFFSTITDVSSNWSAPYMYMGTIVTVGLLIMRYVMDFTYRDSMVADSLWERIEQKTEIVEDAPMYQRVAPEVQEEIVDRIAMSIRQTAVAGGHFSKMLSAEEEEIMREIIKEFM